MDIQGKIISATPGKSGVNQNTGKKWQKYEIVITHALQPNGEMMHTFDDQYLRIVGKEGEFEYTEDPAHPNWGKTLQRLPRQSQGNRMDEEFGKLHRKLEELIEMVSLLLPIKKDNTPNEDSEIPF